jgi:hypothetical protein
MKISPIGSVAISPVYADLFSHPVARSHFKSQKDRLLVNQLEPKDRVTISPEARMWSALRQQYQHKAIAKTEYKLPGNEFPVPGLPQNPPALPDRELPLPIGKPEQPPPIHSPFPQPPRPDPPIGKPEFPELPRFIPPPNEGGPRIPEWWLTQPPPGVSPIEDGGGTIICPPTTRPEPPIGSVPIDEDWVRIPERPGPPEFRIGPPHINPSDDFTIPEDILESIKQAIANKLSVPVEDITIVDQVQVSWPDTSMGNPQPGSFYAQVIVPGYKITVQVGEDKHVGEFYAVLDYGGSQLEYVAGSNPLHDQPPVVAIPEQRNPESPDPMPEETKTHPIAPVAPLQNLEQSISRDQIESHIIDRDEQ